MPLSQIQKSKYKNIRSGLEPALHWSLTSLPFFKLFAYLELYFDATCKTGPINVTLDGFSVSLRTGPHSQSHGQYWMGLWVQKKELGAMLRPGTGWTYSQQQNDPTQITLQLHCKPGICAYHLRLPWGESKKKALLLQFRRKGIKKHKDTLRL